MKCNYCGECAELLEEDTEGNGYCECQTMIVNCADEACNDFIPKEDA
jgi:hypothetical protein